jgi:hypothetical protein
MTKAGTTLAMPAYEDLTVATALVCRGGQAHAPPQRKNFWRCFCAKRASASPLTGVDFSRLP